MVYNGTRCLTHDEVIDYVETVRTNTPAGSATMEAQPIMCKHIAQCHVCAEDARREHRLQDRLDMAAVRDQDLADEREL